MRFYDLIMEAPNTGRSYQHIEDLVFTDGSNGGLHAVERLRSMAEPDSGVEVKMDGSPVIYWGRDESGKFMMIPKNAWGYLKRGVTQISNGTSTVMDSPEAVADFIRGTGKGDREEFAQAMASLFPLFEQISPESGFIEGGILFSPLQDKILNAKTGEYDFTPNITTFHVHKDSELGKRIANAKLMVAATGYYPDMGSESEGRYPDADQLSTPESVVVGTIYVDQIVDVDHSALDEVAAFIQKNANAIDEFLAEQPGLKNPGAVLYKFFNQNLRMPEVKDRFVNWATENLSAGQAQKILSNEVGLNAVLVAVEKLTAAKHDVLDKLGTGTYQDIRQTKPEGFVQAHPGKQFANDLPGQFVKTINQADWAPRKESRMFEAEQPQRLAVIGWGRGMGHEGHMFLASSVITHAKELGGDPFMYLSQTFGPKDPLKPEEKVAIYQKVFPQHGHIFRTKDTIVNAMKELSQAGYTQVIVVVGDDQVNAFQFLAKSNGKPTKAGDVPYNFPGGVEVIKRQDTSDTRADGNPGPRATDLRNAVDPAQGHSEAEQYAIWRKGMPPELSDDEVRGVMLKVRKRLFNESDKYNKQQNQESVMEMNYLRQLAGLPVEEAAPVDYYADSAQSKMLGQLSVIFGDMSQNEANPELSNALGALASAFERGQGFDQAVAAAKETGVDNTALMSAVKDGFAAYKAGAGQQGIERGEESEWDAAEPEAEEEFEGVDLSDFYAVEEEDGHYRDSDWDGESEPGDEHFDDEDSEEDEVEEASKPDYLDLDDDGDTEEPMKKAAEDEEVEEAVESTTQNAMAQAMAELRKLAGL